MPLSALDIMGHFHCTSKSSGISRSAMLSSRVGLLPSERQMQIFPLMLVVVAVSGQDAESQNAGRCIGCLEGLLIHVRRSLEDRMFRLLSTYKSNTADKHETHSSGATKDLSSTTLEGSRGAWSGSSAAWSSSTSSCGTVRDWVHWCSVSDLDCGGSGASDSKS